MNSADEDEAAEASATLADVPQAVPALTRAAELGALAARVGFDWTCAADARAKVDEELVELDAAIAAGTADAVAEELGDLLFTLANFARHLHTGAEEALRQAGVKFERRFGRMEQRAAARGMALSALSAAQWDSLWNESKDDENDSSVAVQ